MSKQERIKKAKTMLAFINRKMREEGLKGSGERRNYIERNEK